MAYEPAFERFEVAGPDGRKRAVLFRKAGFLAMGEQPELFFFDVSGEEVVVGIAGQALRDFQRAHRYLSREEKIDLAGLWLKRQIEAGALLESENLFIREQEFARLANDLGFLA